MDCAFDSCILWKSVQCSIFHLMQWQSHFVDMKCFPRWTTPGGWEGASVPLFLWTPHHEKNKKKETVTERNLPKSSSRCVALYICLSFCSCFSIFRFASLCAFSSFLWSSVLLLHKQPIFPQVKKKKRKGIQGRRTTRRLKDKMKKNKWAWRGCVCVKGRGNK